ncbi:MAG TPA: GNAT family N-acetyltransferase [Deltaproteobacteria bacterium]|nr:GNAT family N-acetyltransferase [Deltaproteobacteria bacterium]
MTWRWLSFEALELSQLYQVVQLREAVFVVEQECAYLDADGRDRGAHHLLGVRDGALVAYLRAFAPGADGEACLGRVVVAASARGIGLGSQLMRRGMAHAWQTWGPCPIHLSAQAHLAAFYGALGYEITGEGYLEDGIPHLPMACPAPDRVPEIPP